MEKGKKTELGSSTQKIKVLVAAPGSTYSTYDMYRYLMDAMERNPITRDSVSGFAFHNIIFYHAVARTTLEEQYDWPRTGEMHDLIRACRELLLEVYINNPDVVLFIDGSKYPPSLFHELQKLIRALGRTTIVAGYLTEAPYIDEPISMYDSNLDVIFTNDFGDYKKRNSNESLAVYYLPHSYSTDIHYSLQMEKDIDVFFCGTIFPERSAILRGVNWNGINAKICGAWALAPEEDFEYLKSIGVAEDGDIPNENVAEMYRRSKIVINLGRTYGWDKNFNEHFIDANEVFSMGPRVVEATACGALVISEWRPEIEQVYGHTVPIFSSSGELESLIRYYLQHEGDRSATAQASCERSKTMSYDDRLRDIIIPAFRDAIMVKQKTIMEV